MSKKIKINKSLIKINTAIQSSKMSKPKLYKRKNADINNIEEKIDSDTEIDKNDELTKISKLDGNTKE